MNPTKRLFLAIKLNDALGEHIQDLKDQAKTLPKDCAIRWTAPENHHLTLLFLGDTDAGLIPGINQAMDQCVKSFTCFNLIFVGLGCFQNAHKPRILWMGVENTQDLRLLYNRLVLSLSKIIKLDRPKFTPHVTLARVKDYAQHGTISGLNGMITTCAERNFGSMIVENVTLFESELNATGPIYRTIHHSMLK